MDTHNMLDTVSFDRLAPLMESCKAHAIAYYEETGKPLGITSEYGEYKVAKLLGLTLLKARYPGVDALDETNRRIQIKTRVLQNPKRLSEPMGSIKLTEPWDILLLLILDKNYDPIVIYEASRDEIENALARTDSKARGRGTLSIREIKNFRKQRWPIAE